jgi:regulation of enolase protein 1 (concanavalin A-like superfamily)
VVFSTTIDPSGIESDDFNATVLDGGLWQLVDPVGDGQAVMTGNQLELSVPAGTSHDVWRSGNFAARVMQAAADEDFEIEVKFESAVSEKYQLQGLLVEEDAGNYLRFDFYSDGKSTRLFAASFSGGSPSVKKNVSIGSVGAPLYMRVTRQGDQWTQLYSLDGVNWLTGAEFSRSLVVAAVGVFAGNAGSSAPAHTAVVDYFFNTASPIIPEDGID